jgi:hypothetical protein
MIVLAEQIDPARAIHAAARCVLDVSYANDPVTVETLRILSRIVAGDRVDRTRFEELGLKIGNRRSIAILSAKSSTYADHVERAAALAAGDVFLAMATYDCDHRRFFLGCAMFFVIVAGVLAIITSGAPFDELCAAAAEATAIQIRAEVDPPTLVQLCTGEGSCR